MANKGAAIRCVLVQDCGSFKDNGNAYIDRMELAFFVSSFWDKKTLRSKGVTYGPFIKGGIGLANARKA